MVERNQLWSVTGGLFALACAILLVAAMMALGLLMPARYQFASSALLALERAVDGQVVWRGDTLTGRVALCATEPFRELAKAHDQPEGIITKC
jgi:hypothetical protein